MPHKLSGNEMLHKLMPNLHEEKRVQASALHRDQKARGTGVIPKGPRAVGHHIVRLEKLMKHDNVEDRIWESAINELLIQEDDIPESFWEAQSQLARNSGINVFISSRIKREMASNLRHGQSESLCSWARYFKENGDQYPTWFKFYAWDGMSRLGIFDNKRGRYRKRDKLTVAPFPQLNPSALAKVYDLVEGFRNGQEMSAHDTELVKKGSFNLLYSHYLKQITKIVKAPKNPEDVRGQWSHISSDEVEELMKASEGTPWCTAGKKMAENHLYNGEFYMFHLEDPQTGILSPTASVAVQLHDGHVVNYYGVQGGSRQELDESLVPTVVEKVKSLPGGERQLLILDEKMELMRLDQKFQAGEEYSVEDLRFLYEIDKKFLNANDFRIKELMRGRIAMQDLKRVTETNDDQSLIDALLQTGNGSAQIAKNIKRFTRLTSETAMQLISVGFADTVLTNAKVFSGLVLDGDLAETIITSCTNSIDTLLKNSGKFTGFETNLELADRLIAMGDNETIAVINNSNCFPGLVLNRKFIDPIIERGGSEELATAIIYSLARRDSRLTLSSDIAFGIMDNFENGFRAFTEAIYYFENLDMEVASRLIENGSAWTVLDNNQCFEDNIFESELAEQISELSDEDLRILAYHIDIFSAISVKTLQNLLDADALDHEDVRNLYINGAIDADLAKRLADNGPAGQTIVINHMSSLEQPTSQLADALATSSAEGLKCVVQNIELFDELSTDLAQKILDQDDGDKVVVDNIDRFRGLKLDNALANRLLEADSWEFIVRNWQSFSELNAENARALIYKVPPKKLESVMTNTNLLANLKYDEDLANILIAGQSGAFVLRHLDHFGDLHADTNLIQRFVEHNDPVTIILMRDTFDGFKLDSDFVNYSVEHEKFNGHYVFKYISDFERLSQYTALLLVKAGWAEDVLNNTESFEDLNLDSKMAEYFIRTKNVHALINNIGLFSRLDERIARFLIDTSYAGAIAVAKNQDAFDRLDERIMSLAVTIPHSRV